MYISYTFADSIGFILLGLGLLRVKNEIMTSTNEYHLVVRIIIYCSQSDKKVSIWKTV